jgi:hypothetical protein
MSIPVTDESVVEEIYKLFSSELVFALFNHIIENRTDEMKTQIISHDIPSNLGTNETILLDLVYFRRQDDINDTIEQHKLLFDKYYTKAYKSFILDIFEKEPLQVENYSKDKRTEPSKTPKTQTFLDVLKKMFRAKNTSESTAPSIGIYFYPMDIIKNNVKIMFSFRGHVYQSYYYNINLLNRELTLRSNVDGITMSSKKIRSVPDFPMPRKTTESRSSLGLTNYFRGHVPNHSTIVTPLHTAKKQSLLVWTDETDTFNGRKKRGKKTKRRL